MSSKPTYIAYTVKDRGEGKKPFWVRIGAAWPFENGSGFTVHLEALPLDGRVVLSEPKPEVDPADALPKVKRR
ncbi:MAG TPA: hypothetical protein VH206_09675 [Xanthobacteraceae bacterium]|jgi:hypothetical protein|nr:hypothetical protein [Xanthobacteraceae bacterium]